jgi:exodeoxyribonuclease V alpha subunit
MTATLQCLYEAGFFKMIDVQFAKAVARIGGENDPLVHLAAALASRVTDEGHVCVELHRLAAQPIETAEGDAIGDLCWPEADSWYAALQRSPLVSDGEKYTPLVLDAKGRLYLRKLWRYQERLAEALRRLAQAG